MLVRVHGHSVHLEVPGQLELILSFHPYQASRDETQVTRLLQSLPLPSQLAELVCLKRHLQAKNVHASRFAALSSSAVLGSVPGWLFMIHGVWGLVESLSNRVLRAQDHPLGCCLAQHAP